MERLRDRREDFVARGAVVLGISLDSVESHRKFKEQLKLPFTLLADVGGDVAKAYGVYSPSFGGVAKRSVFVIDEKGRLAYVDPDYDLRSDAAYAAIVKVLGPFKRGQKGSGESSASVESLFSADEYRRDLQTLSSDEFEGRGIASAGETKTVAYLVKELKEAGYRPGCGGSFEQKVPFVSVRHSRPPTLRIGAETLRPLDDFVAFSHRQDLTAIEGTVPLLFVGYGCAAPEYRWDDYKGVDCKGRALVMLINDPPLEDGRFGGKAMTYYGRWTYKFEEAARRGAAGVILVHETEPAAYPWEVVRNSWGAEQFDLQREDRGASRCRFESWITRDAAIRMCSAAKQDFEKLKAAAAHDDFKPVPLDLPVAYSMSLTLTPVESRNVVGLLPGADAARGSECLILSAHWDHFGRNPELKGDQIFNGAIDNGSGCSGVLALARAIARAPAKPARSTIVLFVTGEERGLLGSQWYADHPVLPLAQTAGVINLDGMNVLGRTKDVSIVGMGQSSLEDLLADAVKEQGRVVAPDPEPEKGHFYRSDQLSFARKGVPSLFIGSGIDYLGRPAGWGAEQRKDYVAHRYHKPADEFDPSWSYDGTLEDLAALYAVARHVLDDASTPQWRASSEFRAIREGAVHGGAR